SLRSHVHATWPERYSYLSNELVDGYIRDILDQQDLWSTKIPSMLSGYFKDMGQLLSLLGDRLAPGARAGFVVSNSFYGGVPIATDLLLAQTAAKLGYKTVGIDVYRGIVPSSQQYKLIEDKYFMRESLVIVEKI
ncbi:MAG: hypothetical protein SFU99_07060, partial [Saprospiraceae bacterium]|nr:hypothetical protein [Saprospiraceae bacterium]